MKRRGERRRDTVRSAAKQNATGKGGKNARKKSGYVLANFGLPYEDTWPEEIPASHSKQSKSYPIQDIVCQVANYFVFPEGRDRAEMQRRATECCRGMRNEHLGRMWKREECPESTVENGAKAADLRLRRASSIKNRIGLHLPPGWSDPEEGSWVDHYSDDWLSEDP